MVELQPTLVGAAVDALLGAADAATLALSAPAAEGATTITTAIILALAIGALITLFDGISRYNTRDRLAAGKGGATDSVDIPPRYFTSERGYIASVLLYLAAMETIYLLPSIVVPSWLNTMSGEAAVSTILPPDFATDLLEFWGRRETFPIIWALLLVGALRYLPWLNQLEPRIRSMCHNIAEIPHFVHEVARRLYIVDFDVRAAFPDGIPADLHFVAAEHFNAPQNSEARYWSRLCYAMRELEELRTELGSLATLHFGARFADEYDSAAAELRSLSHRMARYFDNAESMGAGSARAAELGDDQQLKLDLRRLLGRVELLFVILLNLKHRDERAIIARLHALGFKFDSARLRSEVGPDAAVSVLALAVILFFVSPLIAVLVDWSALELFGDDTTGYIAYPKTIVRADQDLFVRVMVILLLSFVVLLVLAFANLSIARRFAGINPKEMFAGDWLRRPYDKYARASLFATLLVFGTALLMVFLMSRGEVAEAMPVEFRPLLLGFWFVPLFLMGVLLHVLAHNKGNSFLQVVAEGLVSGIVWGAVVFVTGFFFFGAMGEIGGDPIPRAEVPGAAIYYGFYAFLVGTAFMSALLGVSKTARQNGVAGADASADSRAATPAAGVAHGNVTALRR
jgi:hypothetical protein